MVALEVRTRDHTISVRPVEPLEKPQGRNRRDGRGHTLQAQVSPAAAGPACEPPRRVLVVDDDTQICEVVAPALRDEGYEVATAQDGRTGLERVRAHGPDGILLDVHMPILDGCGFAALYERLPGPHAPIIAFTTDRAARWRMAELGAAGFGEKPFDLDALLELIRRHAP